MIREVFQEHGLPEDLAYLAMIESGFNPHAYSHAHACGMWQFIQGTGRRYGLAINNYVDERRDPVKSTQAAAQYLLDLYKQFGSWYLAAASYNCGEGRVQREIDGSTHKNFWELSANQCLPGETQNYVPQMIAATIIAKNPEKFGFKDISYLPPLKYDTVKVDEPTSLRAAAIACNVPLEEVELLNPALRKGVTPPDQGAYVVKIPKDSQELFTRHIQTARLEAPAQASAAVRTASSPARSSYTRKQSSSRKTARSSRSKRASSRKVASSKNREHKTARTSKGKAGTSHQKGSVQVASVLAGGGKSSRASKDSSSNSKNRSKSTSSNSSAKKSRSKANKKKVSSGKSSQSVAAARGKTSRSHGKKSSKVAKSNKKSPSHTKRKPVQTAAKSRPNSS